MPDNIIGNLGQGTWEHRDDGNGNIIQVWVPATPPIPPCGDSYRGDMPATPGFLASGCSGTYSVMGVHDGKQYYQNANGVYLFWDTATARWWLHSELGVTGTDPDIFYQGFPQECPDSG